MRTGPRVVPTSTPGAFSCAPRKTSPAPGSFPHYGRTLTGFSEPPSIISARSGCLTLPRPPRSQPFSPSDPLFTRSVGKFEAPVKNLLTVRGPGWSQAVVPASDLLGVSNRSIAVMSSPSSCSVSYDRQRLARELVGPALPTGRNGGRSRGPTNRLEQHVCKFLHQLRPAFSLLDTRDDGIIELIMLGTKIVGTLFLLALGRCPR